MSAGDIDDKLGPADELSRLRSENPKLNRYILYIPTVPIFRAEVPFSAGITQGGRICYIDPRLDTILDGVDISPALREHECTEWALRWYCQIGMDYAGDPRGHRLANRAEYEKVLELIGPAVPAEPDGFYADFWRDRYDSFLDPQVRFIETAPLTSVPRDLDLYPYANDEKLLARIKEAQR